MGGSQSTTKSIMDQSEEPPALQGDTIFAPSAFHLDPPDSCVMCNKRQAKQCTECRSTYYCSKQCQSDDWPKHKLLCKQFSTQGPRPSPIHKRAIFFPVSSSKPQMIWVPCRFKDDEEGPYENPDTGTLFGDDKPYVVAKYIEYNPIRNRRLGSGMSIWAPSKEGYSIALMYREAFLIDGSTRNESLLASVGQQSSDQHDWRGPLLAIGSLPSEFYQDVTLADFRHLIDYIVDYSPMGTRVVNNVSESIATSMVRGVRVCCYGEIKLHGSEPFVPINVPKSHPLRKTGDVSPISRALGMPLRMWKDPGVEKWIDPPGWDESTGASSNQNAAFLMMSIDLHEEGWGWAPFYWQNENGNVTAAREDGGDLDHEDLRLMCYFVREKLQPMMEDAMGVGDVPRTKEEVVNFITRQNMERYRGEAVGYDGGLACFS